VEDERTDREPKTGLLHLMLGLKEEQRENLEKIQLGVFIDTFMKFLTATLHSRNRFSSNECC
jgi:hypothetical protein